MDKSSMVTLMIKRQPVFLSIRQRTTLKLVYRPCLSCVVSYQIGIQSAVSFSVRKSLIWRVSNSMRTWFAHQGRCLKMLNAWSYPPCKLGNILNHCPLGCMLGILSTLMTVSCRAWDSEEDTPIGRHGIAHLILYQLWTFGLIEITFWAFWWESWMSRARRALSASYLRGTA